MDKLDSNIEFGINKKIPNSIECEIIKIKKYTQLIIEHYEDREAVDQYIKRDENLNTNKGLYEVINHSYSSGEEIVSTFLKLCIESEKKAKLLIKKLENTTIKVNELNQKLDNAILDKNKVEFEANTDKLTGLSNRRKMELIINLLKDNVNETNKGVSIALLDIDNFKEVNTQHGIDGGDFVLENLGNYFREWFGTDNSYQFFRIGGEEFVVLSRVDINIFNKKMNGFLKFVSSKIIIFKETNKKISITFSAGILSTRDENGKIKGESYIRTELGNRMKKAKEEGKNRIVTEN